MFEAKERPWADSLDQRRHCLRRIPSTGEQYCLSTGETERTYSGKSREPYLRKVAIPARKEWYSTVV